MAVTTDGNAVAVGLMPDPFAHQLAFATQMSRFDFSDASVDPRELLWDPQANDGDGDYGINIILLNSVARPLQLVDTVSDQLDPGNGQDWGDCDFQLCYPSYTREGAAVAHVVPAAQPYPVRSQHLLAGGGTAMLAGVGFYRFDAFDQVDITSRALSFSLGDSQTPLVGVHIRLTQLSRGFLRHNSSYASVAVTADLETDYTTLDNFRTATLTDPLNHPISPATYATSSAARGSLTVWAAPFPHDVDRLGTNSVVVWVRDISSTVG